METALGMLKALEGIRSPFLDTLIQLVTRLGEELIIFGVICLLYWCINKDAAYKLGMIFFVSGITVQGLKVTFRVERPFVLDPSLTPVSSAIEAATGYSFPSGHTQGATSLYGYFAYTVKNKWLKVLFVLAFVAVAFSRMYLGVHTIFDVAVSMAVTLAAVILINKFYFAFANGNHDAVVSIILASASLLLCIYSFILAEAGYVDPSQINDCFKSGGAGLGFALGFYLERKYLRFDVKADKLYIQILKMVAGIAGALVFKSGLKLIASGNIIVDFVRYFLTILWVIYLFPLIFSKCLKNNKNI